MGYSYPHYVHTFGMSLDLSNAFRLTQTMFEMWGIQQKQKHLSIPRPGYISEKVRARVFIGFDIFSEHGTLHIHSHHDGVFWTMTVPIDERYSVGVKCRSFAQAFDELIIFMKGLMLT